MNLAVESPYVLVALLLAILPLFSSSMRHSPYPYISLIPTDILSTVILWSIRVLGALTIITLVLGLAGLHQTEQSRERIGFGANIVLLIDRSNSMDTTFAGKTPDGSDESKSTAAKRLLTEFIQKRPHDRIGVAAYSTAPLFVLPLTENKQAIQAAIDAISLPALAYTHISKGLSMALSFFDKPALTGSRIVLLVSDGAAAIDHDSDLKLRQLFAQQNVRLYWIFLRTPNGQGLYDLPQDSRDDNNQAMPERYLHLFFSSLGIPYQAYQAENLDAMQKAIEDINHLEQSPLHYLERIPKDDLSSACYLWATLGLFLLLAVKCCEVKTR
jgi:mxaC protein